MTASAISEARAIGGFYDLMGQFLDDVYGDNIHFGYWDGESGATLSAAQHRLNDLIAERLGLSPGHQLLDVGCGTGGPGRRIATVTGASVTGVTVSAWQATEATRRAKDARLAERTTFSHADACDLPYSDATFDAAMALETLVHISDKPRALAEVRRVLRPGGRFAIADLTRRAVMTAEQEAAWATMPVAKAVSAEEYRDLLVEAGFTVERILDCTSNIAPSFDFTRTAVIEAGERLAPVYGPRTVKQLQDGLIALLTISQTALDYTLLVASRP